MIKLGFDIDGTVAHIMNGVLSRINTYYNKNVKEEDISQFAIEECTNLNSKQVWKCVDESIDDWKNTPAYPGAIWFIWQYYSIEKQPIRFITGRHERHRQPTMLWLESYLGNIPFTVDFTSSNGKMGIINKYSLDGLIEDRVEEVIELARNSVVCFLPERHWNKWFRLKRECVANPYIFYFRTWEELWQELKNKA